jgi:hypothetical protein
MTPEPQTDPNGEVSRLRKALLKLSAAQLQELLLQLPAKPPELPVVVSVRRRQGRPVDLAIKCPDALRAHEQLAWTCPDGRLEIRFSPALSPFIGHCFETIRGGKVTSGTPTLKPGKRQTFSYKVLVTTPDGFCLIRDATIAIVPTQATARKNAGKKMRAATSVRSDRRSTRGDR